MIREIIQEAKTYSVKYDTTPNGHFGAPRVDISKKQYDQIKKQCKEPFTDSGFNKFKNENGALTLGYNHGLTVKKILK